MRFCRQVVLPLTIVLLLVAGVTFVAHFTGPPPARRVTRTGGTDEPLRFLTTRVAWDENDIGYVREFELGAAGHYDFWFRNPQPQPVKIALKYQSCACTALELGLVPPAQWQAELGQAEPPAQWQPLGEAEVPGSAVGVLRLRWRGSRPGPARLVVELALQKAQASAVLRRLEVPVVFVPAVRLAPTTAEVPELTAGGPEQHADFDCWSSSRDAFALAVEQEPAHPCFRCAWQPLDESQRRRLEAAQRTRVRSGYRLRVSVAERAGQERLDLGPFAQRLRLRVAGLEDTLVLEVTGRVRGPGRILALGAPDRIDLGSFPRSRGTAQTVTLGIEPPALDLRLASRPADLEVALVPAKDLAQRWHLVVQVPAGRQSGPLPADCAILLEVIGAETRRWRIPVTGQGTQ